MRPELTAATRFAGACECGRWCTYRPLGPGGYAPTLPTLGVTCRGCGAKVTLTANFGQSARQPWIVPRADLDLSALRAHCREQHTGRRAARLGMPRSNRDLAAWHFAEHHRTRPAHRHEGPYVLLSDELGRVPPGQIPRPLGWYTGAEAIPRELDRATWLAAHPRDAHRKETR